MLPIFSEGSVSRTWVPYSELARAIKETAKSVRVCGKAMEPPVISIRSLAAGEMRVEFVKARNSIELSLMFPLVIWVPTPGDDPILLTSGIADVSHHQP